MHHSSGKSSLDHWVFGRRTRQSSTKPAANNNAQQHNNSEQRRSATLPPRTTVHSIPLLLFVALSFIALVSLLPQKTHAFSCYGIDESSPSVCSSHGHCIATDVCACHTGYRTGFTSSTTKEQCAGIVPLKRPSLSIYGLGDNGAQQLQNETVSGYTSLTSINATSDSFVLDSQEILLFSLAGYFNAYVATSGNRIASWGEAARTGTGATVDFPDPRQINGTVHGIRFIASREHTVLVTTDNELYGWGRNDANTIASPATDVTTPIGMPKGAIDSAATIVAVACGKSITLFLTKEGAVYSQGKNDNADYFLGITGLGTNAIQVTPARVTGLDAKTVFGITAGDSHSHVLTTDNQLWGWGSGLAIGDGIGNDVKLPKQIPLTALGGESPWQVCDGTGNGLVLTKEGHVFGWGITADGSAGTGSGFGNKVAPVQVAGSLSGVFVTQIACMASLGVALDESGNVHRWGTTTILGKADSPVQVDLTFSGASLLTNNRISRISAGNGYLLVDTFSIPQCFDIRDDNNTVCSGRGSCSGHDLCVCNTGYTGSECELNVCFTFNSSDTVNVCSGRGSCISPDFCVCTTGYDGSNCELNICYGYTSNDTARVCSGDGRGNCTAPNTCACATGYEGVECQHNICYSLLSNDTVNVCAGHGNCTAPDKCECSTGYTGSECQFSICSNVPSNNSSVCLSRGNCTAPDICACETGYDGANCELSVCFGYASNDTSRVCSGRGTCSAPDTCSCNTGFSGSNCQLNICFDLLSNDTTNVCSGRGNCTAPDTCVCSSTDYSGSACELSTCFGYLSNDTANACSGNGACVDTNTCNCFSNHTGTQCELSICFGVAANDTSVCGGKGNCTAPDVCTCSTGYYSSQCELFNCDGILYNDTQVCNSSGICVAPDTCELRTCFGVDVSNPLVCTGHGSCVAQDNCDCVADGSYVGDNCNITACFSVAAANSSVCSGRGTCQGPNDCSCQDGYSGSQCNSFLCFGVAPSNASDAQDTGRVLEPIIVPAQRDMPEMNVPQCCVMEFSLRTLPMCAMDMDRVKVQTLVPAQMGMVETLATITSATVLKQATQVQYALVTVLVSVSTRATAPQAMVATCATTPPA
eukprot:CAMPEP_0117452226 /NCGR_PEP_ID=MMETSP0759-20121206/9488_1 /TAXON_ID=63605 /ORGANISM="Percolomonas cosmopolitus, Strain WS" /LENGTH=1100 /DNA_ID=CAMNT_0005244999 /DNA_START=380 /DNA_END=3679 /DNA_ORIENTATION=-